MTKKRRISKKRQYILKKQKKLLFLCIFLLIIVIILAYIIFKTNLLEQKINDKFVRYISFNNANTTDILKISNLQRKSNYHGKGVLNNSYVKFNVDGEKNSKFDIVVYPIGMKIDERNIYYYLTDSNDKKIEFDNLSNKAVSSDSGRIIYTNKISNDKYKLKMWVNSKYKGSIKNVSYEIKIKPC